MNDSYQAIYDAVRSRISGGDIGAAIESAMREASLAFYAGQAKDAVQQAATCYESPAVIWRVKLFIDGDHWCALYGENLQDGVAGFGKSPAEACYDFDKKWYAKLPEKSHD